MRHALEALIFKDEIMADTDDSDNQQTVEDQSKHASEQSQFDPSKPNTLKTLISNKSGQTRSRLPRLSLPRLNLPKLALLGLRGKLYIDDTVFAGVARL